MTYHQLYEICQLIAYDVNQQGSMKEEANKMGSWLFTVRDLNGQLMLQQGQDDDFLSLILYFFLVRTPERNREAFYEELLKLNLQNPFIKFSLHEGVVVASIVFQEFSAFTKDFFMIVFRRYLQSMDDLRVALATNYFDYDNITKSN